MSCQQPYQEKALVVNENQNCLLAAVAETAVAVNECNRLFSSTKPAGTSLPSERDQNLNPNPLVS
jgi:hypothetical protein